MHHGKVASAEREVRSFGSAGGEVSILGPVPLTAQHARRPVALRDHHARREGVVLWIRPGGVAYDRFDLGVVSLVE